MSDADSAKAGVADLAPIDDRLTTDDELEALTAQAVGQHGLSAVRQVSPDGGELTVAVAVEDLRVGQVLRHPGPRVVAAGVANPALEPVFVNAIGDRDEIDHLHGRGFALVEQVACDAVEPAGRAHQFASGRALGLDVVVGLRHRRGLAIKPYESRGETVDVVAAEPWHAGMEQRSNGSAVGEHALEPGLLEFVSDAGDPWRDAAFLALVVSVRGEPVGAPFAGAADAVAFVAGVAVE